MVRVTTAAQAAAMDATAIAAGTPSWNLMSAAGRAASAVIRDHFRGHLDDGCLVFAGPGNNGGDAWVVAADLAAGNASVTVVEVEPPKTDDARKAKALAPPGIRVISFGALSALSALSELARDAQPVIVDGVLGTGATGAPRGTIADAIQAINALRAAGARVIALDIPSGVDATSGAAAGPAVRADLTVTFGTMKRGLLRNRDASGAICVVDIGLGQAATSGDALELVDAARALSAVPSIPADANKGTRRRLLVVGGATGMAGASILAARAALRSGIGMVKLCVEAASMPPVQAAEPSALTCAWPVDDAALADYLGWAHCVLLGPGLGLSRTSRELAARVLAAWRGPVVVDADALTAFEGTAERLGELLKGRPAIITPHAVEAQRLVGAAAADIDAGRFEAAALLAQRVRATVLLKGVPTVVSDGTRSVVVAVGTPVLATGGSGDLLGGMVATLLAQTGDPMMSAASGAWVHGRAAEITGAGAVRGVALDDVVAALRLAWRADSGPWPLTPPVIAELPAAGERL
jgi:NAD(P)H-hydrate epimerase